MSDPLDDLADDLARARSRDLAALAEGDPDDLVRALLATTAHGPLSRPIPAPVAPTPHPDTTGREAGRWTP